MKVSKKMIVIVPENEAEYDNVIYLLQFLNAPYNKFTDEKGVKKIEVIPLE